MTKKLITLMVMACAVSVPGAAQNSTPTMTRLDVAQDLRILERKWVDALVKGDVKTLSEILDDTYVDSDEDGNVTDKNGVLAALKSGDLRMTGLVLSGLKVHSYVYAAVVTGRARQSGTFKGQAMVPAVVFTDTFAMINGTWRIVASHRSAPPPITPSLSTPLPSTPPATTPSPATPPPTK